MKVLILGGTGVIGGQIASTLSSGGLNVTAISRGFISSDKNNTKAEFLTMDLARTCDDKLLEIISEYRFIINAVGLIKQRISTNDFSAHLEAVNLNSILPIRLAALTQWTSKKIIHITTDCVFDGSTGDYDENDSHSATDVYGKSKSLGEVQAGNVLNLRCSVIGPDSTPHSLAGWISHKDACSTITGYLNHFWNGITTYSLSRVVMGIIRSGFWNSGTHHLVPSNTWNKFQLVEALIQVCNRTDLILEKGFGAQGINRVLKTVNPEKNVALWRLAGYSECPSIDGLFQESAFRASFEN